MRRSEIKEKAKVALENCVKEIYAEFESELKISDEDQLTPGMILDQESMIDGLAEVLAWNIGYREELSKL